MITVKTTKLLAASFVTACMFCASAQAADKVSAGALNVERPTLMSEGFDWRISGDDNRNATVTVKFRKKGDSVWKTGLPFLRVGGNGEIVGNSGGGEGATGRGGAVQAPGAPPPPPRYAEFKYVVPNMLAGSLFGLAPDTDYEAQLSLSDPDGGNTMRAVAFHTRKEPVPFAGGKVYHVYPVDWTGPKQEPSFIGIMAAYYMG